MGDRELLAKLGPHFAPAGLYERLQHLPFAGRLHCEVCQVEAGSWQEILIVYEVGSSGIADGAWFKLTFKFYSDWALFQTSDPTAANYASAELQCSPPLPGQSPSTVQSLAVRFDQKGHERPYQKAVIVDVIDGYLNAGDHILLRLGDRRAGGPGTRVQTFIDDDFRFRAYIDPLGTSRFVAVPGDLCLQVVAGAPAELRLHGPRFARPGVPLTFRVVLLDRWGNIAQASGGRVRVRLFTSGDPADQVQEEQLEWPAAGWASLGVSLVEPPAGELRLEAELLDPPPGLPALSATALLTVAAALPGPRSLYADLHVHAHDTVGTNSPAANAAYARDVAGIDVLGYTANDFQISDANWALGLEAVEAFNEPGRFVVYPVQEWCGSSTAGGDHNVVFLGDKPPDFPYNSRGEHNRTLLWSAEMTSHAVELGRWPLEELWEAYVDDPENHLIIPHVGGRRATADWHHPKLERLVEITSAWGQFGWLYDEVLRRGYRLGVCGSGDEHRGRPGGGAPGVQVFGVRGGLTGVIADGLDRRSVGRALRARHTWATTGEHTALLVHCGEHWQGDGFEHRGPARIDYQLFGEAGWEELSASDHTGVIWRRNLHQELGYAENLVRLRWGGARIRDRYRWASWSGTVQIQGATILGFEGSGFEHPEEACWRSGPTELAFRSETYGDADGLTIRLDQLAGSRFLIEGRIDGFHKQGGSRPATPFVHTPDFHWEPEASSLLTDGEVRLELGGVELFLALERLSERALPTRLDGSFTVNPLNAPFGWRPVTLHARQRDGSRVWSSAQFIHFVDA